MSGIQNLINRAWIDGSKVGGTLTLPTHQKSLANMPA